MFTEKRIERLEMSASSDPSNAVKQAELYKVSFFLRKKIEKKIFLKNINNPTF